MAAQSGSASSSGPANTPGTIEGFTDAQSSALYAAIDVSTRSAILARDTQHAELKEFMTSIQNVIGTTVPALRQEVSELRSGFASLKADVERLKNSTAQSVRVPSSDDSIPAPDLSRARSPEGQPPSKSARSTTPSRRQPSSSQRGPSSHARQRSPPRPAQRAPSRPRVSFQPPDPSRTIHTNQVFLGLKGTTLMTKRARAMVLDLMKGAFDVNDDRNLPEHNIIHYNGSDKIRVKFHTRDNFQRFLDHAKFKSPYTDHFGNNIIFYAKPDASPADQQTGKMLHDAYTYLMNLDGFDHQGHLLNTDKRRGVVIIEVNGLTFTLLQIQQSSDGAKAKVVPGDISSRLPALPPGLTDIVLTELIRITEEAVERFS